MKKILDFSRWMTQKMTALLLMLSILIFVGFMIWVLPAVSATTKEVTGSTLSPDTSFFYSVETLYQIASDYGEEGRAYYIRSRFTFDVVWPMAYGFFLVAALSLTFKNSIRGKSLYAFNLLPIGGMVFDYLENITAAFVMFVYPQTTPVAYLAPFFTVVKWLFINVAFAVLMVGILIKVFQMVRGWGSRSSKGNQLNRK